MDATAVHEAGHAVMAVRHGVGLDRVTIEPTDPSCRTRAPLGELTVHDALLVLSAGVAAEAKYLKRPVELAGDDRDQAIVLAELRTGAAQTPEDVLARYRALADAEVVVHWRLIERVAGALTRRGTLSGKDVEDLITRAEGGEPSMRRDEAEKAFAQEQHARVVAAAAAAADSRAGGGRLSGLAADLKQLLDVIAHSTRDFVHEKIAAAVQPLERRILDLEARTYMGTWHAQTAYQAGSLVTHDGSLWIARSDSAGVRPGSTHCWQLAARKRGRWSPGKGRGVRMPFNHDDDVRDDTGDWKRVPLDKHSTPEEVEQLIANEMRVCLGDLWVQLARNPDFSDHDRAVVLFRAAVLLAPEVRKNIEHLHAKRLSVQ